MSNPKVRVFPDEAEALGLKVRPNDPGRANTSYRLNKDQRKRLKELRQHQIPNRLFFDIETTPYKGYFWNLYPKRISYDAITELQKIICISYKWQGTDKIKRLTWNKKTQCDKKMVAEFLNIMNTADECVAHNGDRYDVRVLRTRAFFHNIKMRPKYKTFDTLTKSRWNFKFPSNRLDAIAKYKGLTPKVQHEGFSMWKRVMDGDLSALNDMGNYCDGDIITLEDVFIALEPYVTNNIHVGVLQGGFKYECPKCGNKDAHYLKLNITAKGTIKRLMECDSCEYVYEISNRSYMNYLKFNNNAI